ncbi:hypothetical protein JOC77_001348 [Peribacillus deserti]|uniref:MFS transporter n=1 Tax=Peribacillus deserti TaxID=673318 RepID=A0ABS2QFK5_9BACI|nr:hypothetical protein [Peribacillus deserti]MBM7691938.1 hypothetical protein [Peribacillus deserti]
MVTVFSTILAVVIFCLAFLLMPLSLSRKGKVMIITMSTFIALAGLSMTVKLSWWEIFLLEVLLSTLFAILAHKKNNIFLDDEQYGDSGAAQLITPMFDKRQLEEIALNFDTNGEYYTNPPETDHYGMIQKDNEPSEASVWEDASLDQSHFAADPADLKDTQDKQDNIEKTLTDKDTKHSHAVQSAAESMPVYIEESASETELDEAEKLIRTRMQRLKQTEITKPGSLPPTLNVQRNWDDLIEPLEQPAHDEEDPKPRENNKNDSDDLEELYLKKKAVKR